MIDVNYLYSFTTLVTHCFSDLLTITDNIHVVLSNQEIDGVLCSYKHIPISLAACCALPVRDQLPLLHKTPLCVSGLLSLHVHSFLGRVLESEIAKSLFSHTLLQNAS